MYQLFKLSDQTLAGLQFLLPHHLLTRAAHGLAHSEVSWFKNFIIRVFARIFKINWADAALGSADEYRHFNAFFTRALSPGARTVATATGLVVSPCDGTISACGAIRGGEVFQAKGSYYSLRTLLADKMQAGLFSDGRFATIYLSPRDYHRIHMPVRGKLEAMTHVPGRLFSVAPYTVRCIHGLFARNERSIHLFTTPHGPVALVMIGAMVVGSMETVWHGLINPPRGRRLEVSRYNEVAEPVYLERGEEMGRFNVGSTVIMLFPKNTVKWLPELAAGSSVKMGQPIGRLITSRIAGPGSVHPARVSTVRSNPE